MVIDINSDFDAAIGYAGTYQLWSLKVTIPTRQLPQSEPPLSPRQTLPTMYDLPSSENPEEPGKPDEFDFYQPDLLLKTFVPPNWNPQMVFSACDLNIYYDVRHPNWYKRPDWFGVVGVSQLYDRSDLRLSYVTWQEQVSPFVVVELMSPDTEAEDLGESIRSAQEPPTKWKVYEQILRVPYYIVSSRYPNELQAFRLVGGHYEPAELTEGRLPIPELGLSLGLWQGSYQDIDRLWLRWFTAEGELIPTPSEQAAAAQQEAAAAAQQRAIIAEQQAAAAQQRATIAEHKAAAAQQRAERLAAKLRELGVDPDEVV